MMKNSLKSQSHADSENEPAPFSENQKLEPHELAGEMNDDQLKAFSRLLIKAFLSDRTKFLARSRKGSES